MFIPRLSIKNYIKDTKRKMVINKLQKKGLDMMGFKLGLQVNDVRVTLSDGDDVYTAKIKFNGNNITLDNFERAK
jgi:hypothetical protein